METDFAPVLVKRFELRGDWDVVDCEVVELEGALTYSWAAMGLESVVTWTLTEKATGARLRVEQSGFRTDQERAFRGAEAGWRRFFANLGVTLATLPDGQPS